MKSGLAVRKELWGRARKGLSRGERKALAAGRLPPMGPR